MSQKLFKPELMSEKQVIALGADLSVGNDYITETAGFVPLDVKLRRFQEAGQQMQFHAGEFTSADLREAYFSPDFEINPEDELEEIQEKLNARAEFLNKIKAARVSDSAAAAAGTPTEEEQTAEPVEEPEQKA